MREDQLASPGATNPLTLSFFQHFCEGLGQVVLNICYVQESLLLAVADSE